MTRPTYLSAFALSCLLMAGCSDSIPYSAQTSAGEESQISITLRIPTEGYSGSTRAFPTGGEDGDGREPGLSNENSLADVNIFFFKGAGFNPETTDPEAIEVTGVYVADLSVFTPESDDNPFEKKITVKVLTSETNLEEKEILSAPNISFITVINAGRDLSSAITDLKTLREYSSFTSSRSYSDDGYRNFLMTTAYDANSNGNILIDGKTRFVGSNRLEKYTSQTGDPKIEWRGETTVQRVCARVDVMYQTANAADEELIYVTPDGNKVHITNILPVNFMKQPSYLLSKTTISIPEIWSETTLGKIIWASPEQSSGANDRPTSYVIEPSTLDKAAGMKDLDAWYGTSAASQVKTDITVSSNGSFSSYSSFPISGSENNGNDRTVIIGYPDENIQAPSCYSPDFITGLAFRAYFQPGRIWRKTNDSYEATELTDTDWKAMADKTIWRYQPSVGVEGVKESYAYYFSSEADALAFKASRPADLATLTKYENGVCYYNLWLRHYNDEDYKQDNAAPKETYPMEFAIVRNNIYRVAVSFTGPGEPTPTLREPDTMMSRIFVRKWNKRSESSPLQF